MKNQGNITAPKELNNLSVTDHLEMEIYIFSDKKKLRKKCFKEAQRAERQLREIRKAIHEQSERVSRKIEIIKKSQT